MKFWFCWLFGLGSLAGCRVIPISLPPLQIDVRGPFHQTKVRVTNGTEALLEVLGGTCHTYLKPGDHVEVSLWNLSSQTSLEDITITGWNWEMKKVQVPVTVKKKAVREADAEGQKEEVEEEV
ncbi:MAG: hypothetical protein CEO19_418 [Parcubacteria group bacterium Gr01-1014_73]|nr:MAG: hypothetical protein CEO19_418 [Parcubacteria group bacterium Gr01-1014_73]